MQKQDDQFYLCGRIYGAHASIQANLNAFYDLSKTRKGGETK